MKKKGLERRILGQLPKKGELREGKNYRGNSLLSVPGKFHNSHPGEAEDSTKLRNYQAVLRQER